MYFYQPTLLGGAPNDTETLSQEIFGPSALVTTFAAEEDDLRLANASGYERTSYLYSRDFNRFLRVTEQIEFGMGGCNAGVISTPRPLRSSQQSSTRPRRRCSEGIAEYTTHRIHRHR